MAKARRTTFSGLSNSLRHLGFVAIKTPEHVIFKHKTGRPIIILPPYQSSQPIKSIHQMMVWKQLVDAGVIKGNTGPTKFSVKPYTSASKQKKVDETLKVKP